MRGAAQTSQFRSFSRASRHTERGLVGAGRFEDLILLQTAPYLIGGCWSSTCRTLDVEQRDRILSFVQRGKKAVPEINIASDDYADSLL